MWPNDHIWRKVVVRPHHRKRSCSQNEDFHSTTFIALWLIDHMLFSFHANSNYFFMRIKTSEQIGTLVHSARSRKQRDWTQKATGRQEPWSASEWIVSVRKRPKGIPQTRFGLLRTLDRFGTSGVSSAPRSLKVHSMTSSKNMSDSSQHPSSWG